MFAGTVLFAVSAVKNDAEYMDRLVFKSKSYGTDLNLKKSNLPCDRRNVVKNTFTLNIICEICKKKHV